MLLRARLSPSRPWSLPLSTSRPWSHGVPLTDARHSCLSDHQCMHVVSCSCSCTIQSPNRHAGVHSLHESLASPVCMHAQWCLSFRPPGASGHAFAHMHCASASLPTTFVPGTNWSLRGADAALSRSTFLAGCVVILYHVCTIDVCTYASKHAGPRHTVVLLQAIYMVASILFFALRGIHCESIYHC